MGAASQSLSPPGNAPQIVWSVLATATALGTETFTPSFDSTPHQDSLLYATTTPTPLTAGQIEFESGSLQVVAPSDELQVPHRCHGSGWQYHHVDQSGKPVPNRNDRHRHARARPTRRRACSPIMRT